MNSRVRRLSLAAMIFAVGWLTYMQTPSPPFMITLGAIAVFGVIFTIAPED